MRFACLVGELVIGRIGTTPGTHKVNAGEGAHKISSKTHNDPSFPAADNEVLELQQKDLVLREAKTKEEF